MCLYTQKIERLCFNLLQLAWSGWQCLTEKGHVRSKNWVRERKKKKKGETAGWEGREIKERDAGQQSFLWIIHLQMIRSNVLLTRLNLKSQERCLVWKRHKLAWNNTPKQLGSLTCTKKTLKTCKQCTWNTLNLPTYCELYIKSTFLFIWSYSCLRLECLVYFLCVAYHCKHHCCD